MVKLIQNKPSANDSEQEKDNNITKYLESNKDILLDLAKKNYENLVEALINNAIDNAANASSSDLHYHCHSNNLHSQNPFNQTPTE
jgi:type II secretory ATPase GspE/PulE/Tfp pilus assembly ATPase PilB-like protein